jgi:flavodoxin I
MTIDRRAVDGRKNLKEKAMKTLVLFESFFGNTEKVARAIGTALGLTDADLVRVSELKPGQIDGVDVLIVGSPTRAFQPCPDTKAFLKGLPSGALKGKKVAAFDTRAEMTDKTPGILKFFAGIFGYAAEPVAKKLVKKGGIQVLEPSGFIVLGSEGPLKDGELERAAAWIKAIK